MTDHFNQLTEAQAERLALLLEELGEAQQIIGKILRHGLHSSDPTKLCSPTNRELLQKELGDVKYAVLLLTNSQDLCPYEIERAVREKSDKAPRYLHHQGTTE